MPTILSVSESQPCKPHWRCRVSHLIPYGVLAIRGKADHSVAAAACDAMHTRRAQVAQVAPGYEARRRHAPQVGKARQPCNVFSVV